MIPPRIRNVVANDNFELIIEYQNGEMKKYNTQKLLEKQNYYNLKDIVYFKQARNAEVTVEWPNGEDIDPNELYDNSISI